jgi:hypothetical protein
MKDRPILYTGEMVRQIIAGNKTNTRRPDKTGKPPCEVGDRLWVRETWQVVEGYMDTESWEMPWIKYFVIDGWPNRIPESLPKRHELRYAADDWAESERAEMDEPYPWRPSIHMPRWASRLSLEVLEVGRECLSAMTEADAIAEGVESLAEFRTLWDSIYGNGEYAWANNPRVWSVEFRMMEASP